MIPINPEAIGDPNQTPRVYLGEAAGKALGIPQRDPSLPSPTQHPTGQEVDLDEVRRRYDAAMAYDGYDHGEAMGYLGLSADDVPALLADLDAAREANATLRAQLAKTLDALAAGSALRERFVQRTLAAEAERDRMRPVVEAARVFVGAYRNPDQRPVTPGLFDAVDIYEATLAAIETYGTKEGSDAEQ